jgi:hypothetical protein
VRCGGKRIWRKYKMYERNIKEYGRNLKKFSVLRNIVSLSLKLIEVYVKPLE